MAEEVVVPILEIKEEFATCDICIDYYDDKDKSPKILPCFHTFCNNCLEKMFDKSLKQITCPKCQQIWRVDTTIQKKFPQNNMVMNLVEYIRLKNKPGDLVCHQCPNKSKANVRCLDCQQYLCDECASYHKRFPVLKDHKTLLIAEFINMPREEFFQQKDICKLHESMKLDLFCEKCSSAACSSCAHVSHRNHDLHNLKDIYTGRKKKVSTAVKNLQTSTDSSKEHRKKLAEQNETLNVMQQNLLKTIDDSSTLIIQKVKEKAEQLKQHVLENITKQTAERNDEMKLLAQSEVTKKGHTLYCQQALSFARAVEFTDMSEGLENKIKTLMASPELRNIPIQEVNVDLDVFKNIDTILEDPADAFNISKMKSCIEVTDAWTGHTSDVIKVTTLAQSNQPVELQAAITDPQDNENEVVETMTNISSIIGHVLYKPGSSGPHKAVITVNGIHLVNGEIVFESRNTEEEITRKLLFSADGLQRQYRELKLPSVKFNKNKLNSEWCSLTMDGLLIRKPSPEAQSDSPSRMKRYSGVPAMNVFTGPGCTFWQTRVDCDVLKSAALNMVAAEAGVCQANKCDDEYLLSTNKHAWFVDVSSCGQHSNICLRVFSRARDVQHVPITCLKPHASFQKDLGFLLNSDQKVLHIIDVQVSKVLCSIPDIDVSQPLVPLFAVYNPDIFSCQLKVVTSKKLKLDVVTLWLLSTLI
ncbi:E3 ubiquitin-protein ligase Midline-1-like [Gigantopelta aegis]|uniref:E3 ubiquitin-protein ligase Midline-1-like n=1 Tax=Gigantopelta aegis TaxID=1735272 RepID=UPI001B889E6C|nr:E3 ubiquitin-protein ligase Midline-1-like [Gigantopelta aegis]